MTSTPFPSSLPGRAETAGHPPSIEQTNAALMSVLVADLAEWSGCSWAVAMTQSQGLLHPLCVCGEQPDMPACLACTAAVLSRNPHTIAEETKAQYWMPRVVLPIRVRGEVRGVLALGPKKDAREYTSEDRELMFDAAAHTASLLHRDRLASHIAAGLADMLHLRSDLKSARDAQSRFFPVRLPHLPGLDYHAECEPGGEVGGDFFDFVPLPSQSLVASLGDVSGRGISSAIMMSGLQATLRSLLAAADGDIAAAVRDLNRTLCDVSPDNFSATLFCARIDPLRGRLQYVSAGHETALLVRRGARSVQRLESTGTVLGLTQRAAHKVRTLTLDPGDLLVAFTHGVADAVDPADGVLNVVQCYPHARASDLVGHILEAVDRFSSHAGPLDDRTVAVVRYTGRQEDGVFESSAAEPDLVAA
jgi:serine phosphatase RsbU (regulator of sigma subunit)